MANLAVAIAGISLRNPVLPAAGPPGWSGEAMRACAAGGAGALVSKTVSVRPAVVPTPNMAAIPGGLLNTELWSELPVEQFIEREYPLAKETGLPLIISIGYTAEEIAALAPRVRPFADALELSTHYLGDDPTPMVEAIRAAKAAVDVPVFVKLSPFRDMQTAARAAAGAGADGIVAINSFGPCLGVDVETGRLLMGSPEGYGWLSGPALKPLALRCVFDIARAVDLPIIGVGGISKGTDAVEFLMVGASAVGICTAAILQGPQVFGRVARQIDRWLDEHGYASVEEVRGLAIRRWREWAFRTAHVPPLLDQDACTGCGLCQAGCVYGAICVVEQKAQLISEKCYGCGLCVTRCPARALSIAA
ncbi:MAG: 4Fe-4S binding protein [Anaerolineae bacterium]|nr:4Fe-4S binding protein [Anaerolineae bacterium]